MRRHAGRSLYWLPRGLRLFSGLVLVAWLSAHPEQAPGQSRASDHEAQSTYQLSVQRNLVVIRVVVRDSKGRAIDGLHKEDFTLLDNGKPQLISGFSVEEAGAPSVAVPARAREIAKPGLPPQSPAVPVTPKRFVALYFDDLHMSNPDVARSRAAADRYLTSALQVEDRAAVFTSSGVRELEFTADRSELRKALSSIQPRSKTSPLMASTCPRIGEYQAYLIAQVHDPVATQIADAEAAACTGQQTQGETDFMNLNSRVEGNQEARRVWELAALESKSALDKLAHVVGRLAAMPGQRNLVLVSSGFLSATHEIEVEEIIDRALRSSVVINTLDAQGLYAYDPGGGDPGAYFTSTPGRPGLEARKSVIEHQGLTAARDVLATLAAATGGAFFHNSNDLDEGFRTVGALPNAYYVLTFSPQNLKADGAFHELKVRVNSSEVLTVQARRGYFAPGKASSQRQPGQAFSPAKAETESAIFSLEESHGLPVEVHTKYSKLDDQEATLTVMTHLDLRALQFRKVGGRSLNVLTFTTALFDRDGEYVTGDERTLELRLSDETLAKLSQSGLTVATRLTVRAGMYRLREVVRDAEAGKMSSLNNAVEARF